MWRGFRALRWPPAGRVHTRGAQSAAVLRRPGGHRHRGPASPGHVRVSASAVRRRSIRSEGTGKNMADRRTAESTLTKSLRDLDYGYNDLCRYVSYSKNKQSEAVYWRSSPRLCAHARARRDQAAAYPARLFLTCFGAWGSRSRGAGQHSGRGRRGAPRGLGERKLFARECFTASVLCSTDPRQLACCITAFFSLAVPLTRSFPYCLSCAASE